MYCIACGTTIADDDVAVVVLTTMLNARSLIEFRGALDLAPGRWHARCAPHDVVIWGRARPAGGVGARGPARRRMDRADVPRSIKRHDFHVGRSKRRRLKAKTARKRAATATARRRAREEDAA